MEKSRQAAHERRVADIQQWEAAYRDAHGGQAPPEGFMPPVATTTNSDSINVTAILALVFSTTGFMRVVLGHIALVQISKTGERGRGLALAGLIIGYVLAGLLVIWFAVFGIALLIAF